MKYTTFENRVSDTQDISHQHLSNIMWHNKIILGREIPFVMERINKEFNGEVLPYRPHPKFKSEIDYLDERGLLIWKEVDGIRKADIMWGGHIVGEAYYIEDFREDIINNIIDNQ